MNLQSDMQIIIKVTENHLVRILILPLRFKK